MESVTRALTGVGDLCRISYSIVSYLYNGLITSVGGGRANFSAIVYMLKGFSSSSCCFE